MTADDYLAAGLITQREAEALKLHERGMGTRAIALALGISRGAARDRIKNALRKLTNQEAA